MDLSNSSFQQISIKGLSFVGNADGKSLIGLNSVKAGKIEITGCKFQNIHSRCIGVTNTAHVQIKKCLFEDCQSNCITAGNTTSDVQILSNRFLRTGKNLSNSHVITVAGDDFLIKTTTFRIFVMRQ